MALALPHTDSPSIHSSPRQAVVRASFGLAPCFTKRPCNLPEDKTRDVSNRRLPPNRTACTRTSCVPGSSRDFHRAVTPRSLWLRAVVPGDGVVHATLDRFGGPFRTSLAGAGRGRFLPTLLESDRTSDTPVAPSSSLEAGRPSSSFAFAFARLAWMPAGRKTSSLAPS